jgi:hypothetical protein
MSMNAADPPEVLPYKSPDVKAPRGRNWLGIVAFISSLVFNPFLPLAVSPRPFWTAHPLHWIREIVESIPVLLLPLPGVVLGASALGAAALFNQRRGLALAATIIGVCWYICLGTLFVFVVTTLRGMD